MENLEIYNAVREVPKNAQKPIAAGRLKGKTDINPMWRIKALTERFGPCGFGWKYVITDKRLEPGADNEVSAFVDIDLYIKVNGEWSEAIPGTGGSAFVASERNGLYTSDECFKMALTDAISVSCKALGLGADVYWSADESKYSASRAASEASVRCEACGSDIISVKSGGKVYTANQIADMSKKSYGKALCWACAAKMKGENKNG